MVAELMSLKQKTADALPKRPALLLVGKRCVTDTELYQLLQGFNWTDVYRAGTDTEGLASLRVWSGTIVVLDSNVPTLGGLEFLRNMRRQKLNAQVLMRSSKADTVLLALRAGAAGYLRHNAPVDELMHAMECLVAGGHFFETEIAQILALQFIDSFRWPSQIHRLRNA